MHRHTFILFFFFNDTATTEIYTLSLHDALPICVKRGDLPGRAVLARPLLLHLVHLRRIVHTGDVDPRLLASLGKRAEDRAGGDHRRADADAPLRRGDGARHRVHELEAASRTEVRTDASAIG